MDRISNSDKTKSLEKKKALNEITFNYTQEMEQTLEFLRDSKDFLEFKRMKKDINEYIYKVRIKSLMNMALVYFYSLYESFTRHFFREILFYDTEMSKEQINSHFHRFYDLRKKVMQERYHVHLPHQMYRVIKQLHLDRNNIVHAGRKAKPIFETIELCCNVIIKYFNYIQREFSDILYLYHP